MSTTTSENTTPDSRDPLADLDLTPFAFTRRCWVDAPPDFVYPLISDVSLIETWSPSAGAVSYAPGDGPWVGARFSGRNRRDGREWITRSEVVQADPGSAFAFVVGGAEQGIVRWDWRLCAQGAGSVVQQSWRLLRADPVLGDTPEDIRALRDHMASSAETTLVSLAEWIAAHRWSPPATTGGTVRSGDQEGRGA
ncbi:SRPBCC family protein [Nocardiopsis ganjiahuensis]|uniref:SRPBCC family protein n=1 Tax=Nocardiopsis ganjiahuensis TaxID=239984 RepID=UPI00034A044D|nr:SRPBCC family protein [Nocardiopsis ganjiahuensis]